MKTAKPIGTINNYNEIKLPNGKWKSLGKLGESNPLVEQVREGKWEEVKKKPYIPPVRENVREQILSGDTYRFSKIGNTQVVELIKQN